MDAYGFEAKVIEHSHSLDHDVELVTFQLRYPRFIHSEFLTHRVFSRNSSSSRAIPIYKMIEQVRNDPAMPIHWGKNQPGMQAREELTGDDKEEAKRLWLAAAQRAASMAELMVPFGAHKQIVNRILEPFQWMHTVVTATEWSNFYALRDHPDAQPEIAHLATLMRAAVEVSVPVCRDGGMTDASGWHLPYISAEEREVFWNSPGWLARISSARCARVSYLKHDGATPRQSDDMTLFHKLVGGDPIHASPTEHQGWPLSSGEEWCKNFRGWGQHRLLIET